MRNDLIKFNIPAVVATVTSVADLNFLESLSSSQVLETADWFEFRLDNFQKDDQLDTLAEFLQRNRGAIPALITPRHPSEGGVAPEFSDLEFRRSVMTRFLPWADAVDIEMAHFKAMESLLGGNSVVVGSNHDFEKPIPADQMKDRIQFCQENQIAVAKFAMVMNSEDDLESVKEIVEESIANGQKISAMGMGSAVGPRSRIELAKAGSCLNYGFLQQENAPGQLSSRDLKKAISV